MKLLHAFLIVLLVTSSSAHAAYRSLILKSPELPLTTFNITFRTGSADDRPGFEGLAALTAAMLREGGVQKWGKFPARTREQIEDFLFPLAAQIGVSVEKEQTSFHVTVPAADAQSVFPLLVQMILAPAFDVKEFERLRAETLDQLRTQLPREDEEELGKAALDRAIYAPGHPYSHVVAGTIKGILAAQASDLQSFYRTHFTRRRILVGVTGVVSKSLEAELKTVFNSLPEGSLDHALIPSHALAAGRRLTIVKGPFDATGVHLGHPISVTRADEDFPDLYLGVMAFGKHRSFVGRLMKKVREIRGLNYGTYAYIQDFPGGGQRLTEPTQASRSHQAFTLWARPTPLDNGCFLARQVLREMILLKEKGLSPEEFDLTRSHLVGSAPLLAADLERRLGYAIDSAFYGVKGDYLKGLQAHAKAAKLETVNSLLKKYLDPDHLEIVAVTPDPDRLRAELLSPRCDIHYGKGMTVSTETKAEDEIIATFPMGLKPEAISVIEGDLIFQE